MSRLTLSEQVKQLQYALEEAKAAAHSANLRASAMEADHDSLLSRIQDQIILHHELEEANRKVAELEKSLSGTKSTSDMYYKNYSELKAEMEQLHMILDAVEEAPSRYIEAPADSYRSRDERSLATRLAGTFLALAKSFNSAANKA